MSQLSQIPESTSPPSGKQVPNSTRPILVCSRKKATIIEHILNTIAIPKTLSKTLNGKEWKQAMRVEMEALERNGTWDVTYGVDYQETFTPVVKMNTLRVLLSLAAQFDWELQQFDVKNVFLHGELKEEIYMDLSLGFNMHLKGKKVCKLKKALYGLKQFPQAWFGRFVKVMITIGYKQSHSD
ncbi:Retrovirus-related Pol polyprotein from transposon TNT 1-94 [Vitis vinifera]|uniref:Retrovirus-related Pol polyprotein from transposon TNT 1-94 n=1 Tax=Vitis vinifera TaxID=29760 RepID=A0A438HLN4_VITVI|nr:Retrovirus-related Pol polyprotein from transposon TNT 1-94 [Vitis vinifera]